MSLEEAFKEVELDINKLLEMHTGVTFQKLSHEDQVALRSFFRRWAEAADKEPETSSAGLIAIGFMLGHNWVKDHWALW